MEDWIIALIASAIITLIIVLIFVIYAWRKTREEMVREEKELKQRAEKLYEEVKQYEKLYEEVKQSRQKLIQKCDRCGAGIHDKSWSFCPWCGHRIYPRERKS